MTLVESQSVETQDESSEAHQAYARAVGARLRDVRRQKGLSLQAVETATDLEFKASVMGAYERGERAISVPRLQRLAKFYEVSVDTLLPSECVGGASAGSAKALTTPAKHKLVIDLTRLRAIKGPERDLLARFLAMIQAHRGDFNGKMITIRDDDVRAISCLFGSSAERMELRLDELGLLVH
jgi:transcriptional regulator with XRE-family HTH domain